MPPGYAASSTAELLMPLDTLQTVQSAVNDPRCLDLPSCSDLGLCVCDAVYGQQCHKVWISLESCQCIFVCSHCPAQCLCLVWIGPQLQLEQRCRTAVDAWLERACGCSMAPVGTFFLWHPSALPSRVHVLLTLRCCRAGIQCAPSGAQGTRMQLCQRYHRRCCWPTAVCLGHRMVVNCCFRD